MKATVKYLMIEGCPYWCAVVGKKAIHFMNKETAEYCADGFRSGHRKLKDFVSFNLSKCKPVRSKRKPAST